VELVNYELPVRLLDYKHLELREHAPVLISMLHEKTVKSWLLLITFWVSDIVFVLIKDGTQIIMLFKMVYDSICAACQGEKILFRCLNRLKMYIAPK
jgi:hypothetical protein